MLVEIFPRHLYWANECIVLETTVEPRVTYPRWPTNEIVRRLNGALLVLKAELMAMVSTDGYRLAHVEKLNEQLEGVAEVICGFVSFLRSHKVVE